MIGLFLLMTAQAATVTPPDASPPAPPAPHRICRKAPGSDTIVCKPAPKQEPYLVGPLPAKTYGPPLPNAGSVVGHGVTVRGQASNAGRRHRPMATVSVPF